MDRHKCVVCGKTRNRKFLTQFLNYGDSMVWLCDRSVTMHNNQYLFKIDNSYYAINKCQIRFLYRKYEVLNQCIENYFTSVKMLAVYDKILLAENVAPELTFLKKTKPL